MILRKLPILIAIGVLASSAAHGLTATDVVRKAQSADSRLSYRGTKAACIAVGGRLVCSTMQVIHLQPDLTRTEYNSPKALAGVIVIQRGPAAWRYSPKKKQWERLPSSSALPAKGDLGAVLSNYSLRFSTAKNAAVRNAYVVVAAPKRAGESIMTLWIDKNSYLTLKTQVKKPSSELISSTSFTKVAVGSADISRAAFNVPLRGNAEPKSCKPDFEVVKPKYLPRGYKAVGRTTACVHGHACVHLQFTNGVKAISVFERRAKGTSRAPHVPDRLNNVMTWTRHDVLFTLIGELPRPELQKIADSIP